MQDTYRSLDSRMNQEVLRRNVLRVLRIWRSWFIFSDDFLNGLQASSLLSAAAVAQISQCLFLRWSLERSFRTSSSNCYQLCQCMHGNCMNRSCRLDREPAGPKSQQAPRASRPQEPAGLSHRHNSQSC